MTHQSYRTNEEHVGWESTGTGLFVHGEQRSAERILLIALAGVADEIIVRQRQFNLAVGRPRRKHRIEVRATFRILSVGLVGIGVPARVFGHASIVQRPRGAGNSTPAEPAGGAELLRSRIRARKNPRKRGLFWTENITQSVW